jgi:hypothetical protein
MGAYWPTAMSQLYFQSLAALGLVVNFSKTYRSPTGLIFVEELFKLGRPRTLSAQEEPPAPPAHQGPIAITLWDWVRQELGDPSERKYIKATWFVRPRLSAITMAKRFERGDDTTPLWQVLPAVDCEQSSLATEPWRKARVRAIIQSLHGATIKRMADTGLPLHWPKSLGGWGFSGKQEAPAHFRKAAAHILHGVAEPDVELNRMAQIHVQGALPPLVKRTLKRALDVMEGQTDTKEDGAVYESLKVATKKVT